jgi:transcriptional regulator with XRE-family HTH domain
MTDGGIDGSIDQLVKARWRAIGLSQTDLAEILGAGFQQPHGDNGSDGISADRLMQVAEALDVPIDLCDDGISAGQQEPDLSLEQKMSPLQALLDLRLLRAFHEIRDPRTKRMLVQLAEYIVKRQAGLGEAG